MIHWMIHILQNLRRSIKRLFRCRRIKLIELVLEPVTDNYKETPVNAATTMNDAQMQTVHVNVIDKARAVDSSNLDIAVWASADVTICTVVADASDPLGRSALITGVKIGQAVVTVNIGSIPLSIGVTITASADTSITSTFDAPVDNPAFNPTPAAAPSAQSTP